MSATSEMLNEIREVNLSYLLLAQRLLREDKPMGMFRMGISDQLADVLANLSLGADREAGGVQPGVCAVSASTTTPSCPRLRTRANPAPLLRRIPRS